MYLCVCALNKDVSLVLYLGLEEKGNAPNHAFNSPQLGAGSAAAQVNLIKVWARRNSRRGVFEEWRDIPVSWNLQSIY